MIWLQEYGNKTGVDRPDYKLYYCDQDMDCVGLPDLTTEGDSSYFIDRDKVNTRALDKCKVGDQCLAWGTGTLRTLMPDNYWKAIGE